MVRRFRSAALALVVCSCSLVVNFDENSQPCDDAGSCGSGFSCTSGFCVRVDGGLTTPDGGAVDGGRADGGHADGGRTDGGRPDGG